MATSKVENSPYWSPDLPRDQHTGLEGRRSKSKHVPDGPGKTGFGERMFVQNLPKIEKQEEEDATS